MSVADDLDRIDPVPESLVLEGGLEVELLPLRTRQFFRLLRILTHGAGAMLAQSVSTLDFGSTPEEFTQRFLTMVLFSIPDAEQEAIDFVQSMCRPAGLREWDVQGSKQTDAAKAHNEALFQDFYSALQNPELGDMVDIVEAVVKREADDIQALGKRLSRLLKLAQKTGQDKPGKAETVPEEALGSPASSPASSISSAPSTGGRTRKSSASRSAASARSPRPSAVDVLERSRSAAP